MSPGSLLNDPRRLPTSPPDPWVCLPPISDADAGFDPLTLPSSPVGILDDIGNPNWQRFTERPGVTRSHPRGTHEVAHGPDGQSAYWVRLFDPYDPDTVVSDPDPALVRPTVEAAIALCLGLLKEFASDPAQAPHGSHLWIVCPDGSARLAAVVPEPATAPT
jgi:hypothetical protein